MTSGQRAFRPTLGCSRSTRAAECTDGQDDPAGDETKPADRRDRPEPADTGHGEQVEAAGEDNDSDDEQPAGRPCPGVRPARCRPRHRQPTPARGSGDSGPRSRRPPACLGSADHAGHERRTPRARPPSPHNAAPVANHPATMIRYHTCPVRNPGIAVNKHRVKCNLRLAPLPLAHVLPPLGPGLIIIIQPRKAMSVFRLAASTFGGATV